MVISIVQVPPLLYAAKHYQLGGLSSDFDSIVTAQLGPWLTAHSSTLSSAQLSAAPHAAQGQGGHSSMDWHLMPLGLLPLGGGES